MNYTLIVMIIVLLGTIGWQYLSKRKIYRELDQLSKRLSHIIEQESTEKILMQTNGQSMQELLVQVNRMLHHNQKMVADNIRANESLKKMLSNMSHDLKTPLTIILGYIEQLKQNNYLSESEQREVVDRLHDKTESIISLLRQFFDLVKLESRDIDFSMEKISVNEICRKNILEFYGVSKSKGLKVELDIPKQNYYILGNKEALNRILNNLISNAIHYGSDGGIIGLAVREIGEHVAIDIWDEGKGIDETHYKHVFERLYTLDDARNPEFQGSGLGLSITKQLTEVMNGEIILNSKAYEKTVFTCVFKQMTY